MVPLGGVEDRALEVVEARGCRGSTARSAGPAAATSACARKSPAGVVDQPALRGVVPRRAAAPRRRRRSCSSTPAVARDALEVGEDLAPAARRSGSSPGSARTSTSTGARARRRRSRDRCSPARCRRARRRARGSRSRRSPASRSRIAAPMPPKPAPTIATATSRTAGLVGVASGASIVLMARSVSALRRAQVRLEQRLPGAATSARTPAGQRTRRAGAAGCRARRSAASSPPTNRPRRRRCRRSAAPTASARPGTGARSGAPWTSCRKWKKSAASNAYSAPPSTSSVRNVRRQPVHGVLLAAGDRQLEHVHERVTELVEEHEGVDRGPLVAELLVGDARLARLDDLGGRG